MREYKPRITISEKEPDPEEILKDLRAGSDAVIVFSQRKEDMVAAALLKKILSELGISPERVMVYPAKKREDICAIKDAAQEKIKSLGPLRWENDR